MSDVDFPTRLKRFLTHDVWHTELSSMSGLRQIVARFLRIGQLVLKGFTKDDLPVYASALTFSTLMSLVPMLAIAFALLRGLGAGDEPLRRLMESLHSMPRQFQGFVQQLVDGSSRANLAALGWIGLIILFVTVVQVLGSVEATFNKIWGASAPRTIWRRFTNYISITVVVPVLIMAAFAVSASLKSKVFANYLGESAVLYQILVRLAPFATVWLAFFVLFVFMPNTHVQRRMAAGSSLVTTLIWLGWQKIYLTLQVGLSRYNAIYGTFASLPIFLAWLYACWVIILLGAEFAFALQNHATFHMEQMSGRANLRARITLALSVLLDGARAMASGQATFDAGEYAQQHRVPVRLLNDILGLLESERYMAEIADRPGCYALLKTADRITVREIVDLLMRHGSEPGTLGLDRAEPVVKQTVAQLEIALQAKLEGLNLSDLLAQADR